MDKEKAGVNLAEVQLYANPSGVKKMLITNIKDTVYSASFICFQMKKLQGTIRQRKKK
jgi:hypothetical protein